ncbi:MAG: hypothetical protein PHX34_01305 [Candidatus Shapirobacteria bacterium]|nr:hypothetical protein [Candidatus Shapirobacteria bacterium]
MIYIFHGDDQFASRTEFNSSIDKNIDTDILRVDSKNINPDLINGFLNSQSLFTPKKILAITNFFSVSKPILDKIIKIIKDNNSIDVLIWQDKSLNPTQAKIFPQAKINNFPLDKIIFSCLNQIRPKNLVRFMTLFKQVLIKEPFELFLFFIKNNLRKQLTNYSAFDKKVLQKTYLQLIELDFQNKTGQLSIPKEIALERILLNLIK